MASLLTDGKLFFPNVLKSDPFKQTGYLYQQEPGGAWGLHWVVIDPRKHTMAAWRKPLLSDFVTAAQNLNAVVVTNGPFFKYKGGTKGFAALKVTGAACWGMIKYTGAKFGQFFMDVDPLDVWAKTVGDSIEKNFGSSGPIGHIYSATFSETKYSAANAHHFGRRNGRQFADYTIAQGESPQISEVIGGLLRVVNNYTVATTTAQTNQHGFWGLAPLMPSDPVWSQGTLRQDLEEALENLGQYDSTHNPQLPALSGVIITVFQSATPAAVAALMAGANVKDAVQLDGADSVLLAVNGSVVVGAAMLPHKRAGNTWGYKFTSG